MKAITVQQPYASLICQGIKDIENRSWRTHYRGPVYIHASAKAAKLIFEQTDQATVQEIIIATMLGEVEEQDLFSCIIGQVDIVDCVINHPSIWATKSFHYELGPNETEEDKPKPMYNWVLANPVLFKKPIMNVKGKQSFWKPDYTNCECCTTPVHYEQAILNDECWFCKNCFKKSS